MSRFNYPGIQPPTRRELIAEGFEPLPAAEASIVRHDEPAGTEQVERELIGLIYSLAECVKRQDLVIGSMEVRLRKLEACQ